jgi:type IV pilus assembly protein PilY1
MKRKFAPAALVALALAGLPTLAWGQLVIQDNFTGASSSYNWKTFTGACLTAGDGTGSIPACVGLPYYGSETLVGGYGGTLPDPVGNGALRFTNGYPGGYAQAGSVISNFTYPSGQGLSVTFTTATYRGDSGGAGADGADGMSFFLTDGSNPPYDTGAFGGSLGYTCSNTNNDSHTRADGTTRGYDGLVGAYLGLGIDEYGNFLNGISNLGPSPPNATGDNTATGYGYQPNRIGLRGAGSIAWQALNTLKPSYYPSTLTQSQKAQAVQATCKSGKLWNYSNPSSPSQSSTSVADYAPIPNAYSVLPSTIKIANESATTRGQAVPITYKLKITQNGLLTFSYSYNGGSFIQVITNQDITAGNGPLPASFRFGFAGSTGGSTNVHEVTCFQAAPAETSASSAGLNEKQTAKVQTGSQVYFAFYNPNNWTGSLTASDLLIDSNTGLVSIAQYAKWDASCVLTGVASGQTCVATNVSGPVLPQGGTTGWQGTTAPARVMLTSNGGAGIPFQFGSLTSAQKAVIDAGDATQNADRVNYLRGDRSNEIQSNGTGKFRARASILGDIVNSSPAWVGAPSAPYTATWSDKLYPLAIQKENSSPTTYPTFLANNAGRLNVVYSGANDGFVHGFRSGSYTSSGAYVNNATTPNDGLEVLAYMPEAVLNTIHNASNPNLDYSNPQYGHNFFLDAPPGSGDLYYNNAWHTWLMGGLGTGGAAIYALDITDPTSASLYEGNAANIVIGEWNASTLTHLGNTWGVPQIRRFHNGMWGAVFGNGLGNSGPGGIYVMTVDPTSAAKTFYWLPTSGGKTGNGIEYTTPVDLDGDHVVDYVYAGDVQGNIWRFDLTSSTPAAWAVSASSPLFTTPGNGSQPITTKLVVAATPSDAGPPRILVDFGTGQQVPLTNTSPQTYASGQQSLYGIWDWDMNGWNSKSAVQYAHLGAPQAISTSNLQQQTVLSAVPTSSGYRAVSSNPICWADATGCSGGNTQFGWYLNLPATGEQVIYSPVLELGAFIVNTTIPASNNPLSCTSAVASGWTLAISPTNGGAFTKSFFGDQTGHFVNYNGQIVSGIALNATGSVSIVTTGGTAPGTFLVTQTTSGVGTVTPINPLATGKGSRLTWAELR